MKNDFSIRDFLKNKEALLIHFSTPMALYKKSSESDPIYFPHDLVNASELKDIPLSFSTILSTDRGPSQTFNAVDANSGGSIGIIIDIESNDCVISVKTCDSGSYRGDSDGLNPSLENCEKSIAERVNMNEWVVENYKTIGIFIFPSPRAMIEQEFFCPISQKNIKVRVEDDVAFDDILMYFPHNKIFSAYTGKFLEYNRSKKNWDEICYNNIYPMNDQ